MSEDVEEMITDLWCLRDKPWESAFAMEQKRRNMESLRRHRERMEREAALLNNAAAEEEEEEEMQS